MLSISIIIPTLNEAEHIGDLIRQLVSMESCLEIIVSDGNSSDDTIAKAKPHAKIVQAPRGRATQMNAGADAATGDVLWFLHADCHPHPDSIGAIRQGLENHAIAGGGFEYNLDHPWPIFRLIEVTSNRKNRFLSLLYGDMGIFVRRDIFQRMGGFREIPLMEDMDFCKRLKRFGKIVILPQRIDTSARRWVEDGIITYLLRTQLLKIGWVLGVAPDTLARWYQFKRRHL
jgi:rSAM/selenodomain-associated transferase 2